jgi:hypothetical protein
MYSIPTHPTDSGSSFTEVKNMMQKLMKALDVMEKETLDENKEIKDGRPENQPRVVHVRGDCCSRDHMW